MYNHPDVKGINYRWRNMFIIELSPHYSFLSCLFLSGPSSCPSHLQYGPNLQGFGLGDFEGQTSIIKTPVHINWRTHDVFISKGHPTVAVDWLFSAPQRHLQHELVPGQPEPAGYRVWRQVGRSLGYFWQRPQTVNYVPTYYVLWYGLICLESYASKDLFFPS